MIESLPLTTRAVTMASMFPSVPEVVKRTCSMEGKRWQTSAARRAS